MTISIPIALLALTCLTALVLLGMLILQHRRYRVDTTRRIEAIEVRLDTIERTVTNLARAETIHSFTTPESRLARQAISRASWAQEIHDQSHRFCCGPGSNIDRCARPDRPEFIESVR